MADQQLTNNNQSILDPCQRSGWPEARYDWAGRYRHDLALDQYPIRGPPRQIFPGRARWHQCWLCLRSRSCKSKNTKIQKIRTICSSSSSTVSSEEDHQCSSMKEPRQNISCSEVVAMCRGTLSGRSDVCLFLFTCFLVSLVVPT